MRLLIAFCLTALLAACGFHLRGSYALPFSSIHIAAAEGSETAANLRRLLRANSVEIKDKPDGAQAVLSVTREAQEKVILSLGSTGRVREYQLRLHFGYRLTDAGGRELSPPATITLTRDMSFSDAAVLAKEQEEALLWRDMRQDVAQQVLRRLAAVRAVVKE